MPDLVWPTDYRYPDVTYDRRLDLDVGGVRLELHHGRGETDDHTWVWMPERRVLCSGDLFIWATPNCGNPQKVQRYPLDWARALRAMAALGPAVLLPGHGFPICGAERIGQALGETAELLESLHEQTLALMNAGARLDDVLHTVRAPAHLLARPYLQPVYDEPQFIVRNLWRLYGGWYDGNPAHLKPAPDRALAVELAALAGGAGRLAERATALVAAGDLALACHLAELAAQAAPGDAAIRAARAEVYRARAAREGSVMARGIYTWAAEEAE
jgi:alkyl sulfatase BDS1-like metallo-beta-lactamase superfamily hydrolase